MINPFEPWFTTPPPPKTFREKFLDFTGGFLLPYVAVSFVGVMTVVGIITTGLLLIRCWF